MVKSLALLASLLAQGSEAMRAAGDLESSEGVQPFRVFASSFNAGNKELKPAAMDELVKILAGGHEAPNGEPADLVFVGLQEVKDHNFNLASRTRASVLWKTSVLRWITRGPAENPSKLDWFAQSFNSGKWCQAGKHFNTNLYAFARPNSGWTVTPVAYQSKACPRKSFSGRDKWQDSNRNIGCSLDFNTKWECGKAVNLAVFEVSRTTGSDKKRVCGLNTHMSFAGTAARRLRYITAAMEETRKAKCDFVVFVGDFNTRMHCLSQELDAFTFGGGVPALPFFSTGTAKGGTSFDSILETFCDDKGECGLPSSRSQSNSDELIQMLTRDQIACYEKNKNSTKKDDTLVMKHVLPVEDGEESKLCITVNKNTIKRYKLKEAGPVNFRPTYKLAAKSKLAEYGAEWSRCYTKDHLCFGNKDGGGKHNPAWTDRILVTTFEKAPSKTLLYERRSVPGSVGSDHAAVVTLQEVLL